MSKEGKNNEQRQIPTDNNEAQTQKVIQEQNTIQGEQRNENVKDMPTAAAVADILKDMEFPADKQKIVSFVQSYDKSNSETSNSSEEAISALQKIQDRTYNNVYEVTQAAGLV